MNPDSEKDQIERVAFEYLKRSLRIGIYRNEDGAIVNVDIYLENPDTGKVQKIFETE